MRIAVNLTDHEASRQPLSGDQTYYRALLTLAESVSDFHVNMLGNRSRVLRQLMRSLEPLSTKIPNHWLRRRLFAHSRLLPILPADLRDADVVFSVVLAPRVLFRRGIAQVWYSQGISHESYYRHVGHGKRSIDDVAAFYRQVAARMTMLIVGTHDGYARLQRYCPDLSCPVVVIPMLLSVEALRDLDAKRESELVRLLFVGIDYHRKGLPETLEAYQHLRSRYNCELHIVTATDCPLRERWQNAEDVVWHGIVNYATMKQLYLTTDILVVPTYADTYLAALVEAMAYGVAIVTTSIPPMSEIAPDGEVGHLINPGDVSGLVAMLGHLIENRAWRRQAMQNALSRYRRLYAPEVVLPQLISAFEEAKKLAR